MTLDEMIANGMDPNTEVEICNPDLKQRLI